MEGQLHQAQDRLVKLSEQQLLDCADENYGNFGCRGGSTANAFNYAVKYGVETARKYSYISQQKNCELVIKCHLLYATNTKQNS